ncbi:hypothetical protein Tco_0239602, partial [Tanacetum coccineum]
ASPDDSPGAARRLSGP